MEPEEGDHAAQCGRSEPPGAGGASTRGGQQPRHGGELVHAPGQGRQEANGLWLKTAAHVGRVKTNVPVVPAGHQRGRQTQRQAGVDAHTCTQTSGFLS